MTNINWKVRIKNPMFWVQIVVAIFVPVLGYMGITAQDLTTWQAVGNVILTAFSNPYVLLLMATSVYNAIIDPTTTGITDSKTAHPPISASPAVPKPPRLSTPLWVLRAPAARPCTLL